MAPLNGLGVPVGLLQRAFEDSGREPRDVALAMGWSTPRGYPDGQRVLRSIGLRSSRRRWASLLLGREYRVQEVATARAVRLLGAMGFDPVDYGL
jgi:hypothetical protein